MAFQGDCPCFRLRENGTVPLVAAPLDATGVAPWQPFALQSAVYPTHRIGRTSAERVLLSRKGTPSWRRPSRLAEEFWIEGTAVPCDYRGTYREVYARLRRYGRGSPERELCPAIVAWAAERRLRRVHVLMCGHGYAVAALRRAGVAAFGVDIAARPLWRVRRFVTRGDVIDYTAALAPGSGEGIVTIAGLEHLDEPDLLRVLDAAARTGGPLFAQVSCREDVYGARLVGKPLHLTVRPAAWWDDQLGRRWTPVIDSYSDATAAYLWTGSARATSAAGNEAAA